MPETPVPIGEFVARGYLQELNRQFFHPLGLALGIVVVPNEPDPRAARLRVTRTDDPDGYEFGGETAFSQSDIVRGTRIEAEQAEGLAWRQEHLGYGIQPLVVEEG